MIDKKNIAIILIAGTIGGLLGSLPFTLRYIENKRELETTQEELQEYKSNGREIFPCPFCGSENVELKEVCGWYVHCDDCGASGPFHDPSSEVWDENTKAEAVEWWNHNARE